MTQAADTLSDQTTVPRYWVVIPAAGSGSRMQADRPKQYLTLGELTILEHTLMRLGQHPAIADIVLAIAADDERWNVSARTELSSRIGVSVDTVIGGAERHISVLNALEALYSGQLFSHSVKADSNDWVLIHDAARPCITLADITHLINSVADDPVGGLLGIPVADTMKRVNAEGLVEETVCRDGLWRALTPQMFRLGMLRQALLDAAAQGRHVTDDASAIELAGYRPRMVSGNEQNIKVTRPQDLDLAAAYLRQQEKQS